MEKSDEKNDLYWNYSEKSTKLHLVGDAWTLAVS